MTKAMGYVRVGGRAREKDGAHPTPRRLVEDAQPRGAGGDRVYYFTVAGFEFYGRDEDGDCWGGGGGGEYDDVIG